MPGVLLCGEQGRLYNGGVIFLPLLIFVVGLLIGSFLNVVILRMNTGRTIATGRSMCARCSRPLEWYELIPVFSFLALRGKCRTCKTSISFQYPVVELITGILFVVFYIKIPLMMGFTAYAWLSFLFALVVSSLLIVAAVYDARHKILPDVIMYPFMLLALLAIAVKSTLFPGFSPLLAIAEGVLVGLPFFLLWLLSRGRAMGFGDVKLATGIGWLLGLSLGFGAVILSFWIGALFGLFLIAVAHTHSMKSQVPFGPFLIIGALIAGLWGISIASIFPL